MEIWKPLSRLPGYEVSNKGRVRSLKSGKPKLMTLVDNKKGYLLCCLIHDKKRYTCYAHRLVAEAFIPTQFNIEQMEVNHKDKNRKNNCLENLEWVTPMDNHLHRDDTERYDLLKDHLTLLSHLNINDLKSFIDHSKTYLNKL